MRRILTSKEIGATLREVRKRKGLTQEQLAEKVEVSFQQIQQYENGSSRLNTDKLQAIAFALSVPIGAFFGEGDAEASLSTEEQKLLDGFRAQSIPEVRDFILNCLSQSK